MASKFLLAALLLAPSVLGAALNPEARDELANLYDRDVANVGIPV